MHKVYPEVIDPKAKWLDKNEVVYEVYLPIDKITKSDTEILFEVIASTVPKIDLDELFKTKVEVKKATEKELEEGGWLNWENFQKQFFFDTCDDLDLWEKSTKKSKLWDKMVVDYERLQVDGEKGSLFNETIYIDLSSETKDFSKNFTDLAKGEYAERLVPSFKDKNTQYILKIKCKEVYETKYQNAEEAIEKSTEFKTKFKNLANYNSELKDGYDQQFEEIYDMNFEDACTMAIWNFSKKMEVELPIDFLKIEAQKTLDQLNSISKFKNQDLIKTAQEEIMVYSGNKTISDKLKEAELLETIVEILSQNYKRELLLNYITATKSSSFYVKIRYQLVFKPVIPKIILKSFLFGDSEYADEEFNEQPEDGRSQMLSLYQEQEKNHFIRSEFAKNQKR